MATTISSATESEGRIQHHQKDLWLSLSMGLLKEKVTTHVLAAWVRFSAGFWWSFIGSFFILVGLAFIFSILVKLFT